MTAAHTEPDANALADGGTDRPSPDASPRARRAAAIVSIARDLGGILPPGDVAELRRLEPGRASPAFYKLCAQYLADLLPSGDDARELAEVRWSIVLRALAELGDLARPGGRLGRALASAEVAEPRLLRLLRANDTQIGDALRYVSHQLASRAVACPPVELAELVLSTGEEWGERVRRQIAGDYYSAQRAETE